MRALAPSLIFLASCSALDGGPDLVPLTTDPPGATVRLRAGGRERTMPGVTPMKIELPRTLADPIEIELLMHGYRPFSRRLFKRQDPELLRREEWKWPTEPIHVKLVPDFPSR